MTCVTSMPRSTPPASRSGAVAAFLPRLSGWAQPVPRDHGRQLASHQPVTSGGPRVDFAHGARERGLCPASLSRSPSPSRSPGSPLVRRPAIRNEINGRSSRRAGVGSLHAGTEIQEYGGYPGRPLATGAAFHPRRQASTGAPLQRTSVLACTPDTWPAH